MNDHDIFYLCLTCFAVSQTEDECHGQRMIRCDAGRPGDERRKPVLDNRGRMKSRAPRWFLEAVGSLPAEPEPTLKTDNQQLITDH